MERVGQAGQVLATTTVTTHSVVEFRDMRSAIAMCDPFQRFAPCWMQRQMGSVRQGTINRWLTSDALDQALQRTHQDEKGCRDDKWE